MKWIVTLAALTTLMTGCATTSTDSGPPPEVAKKVLTGFPKGANVYWVPSMGPIADAGQVTRLSLSGTPSSRDVARQIGPSNSVEVQIAIAGPNSTLSKQVLLRALNDVVGPLVKLQLMFIGDPNDTAEVKKAIEARGALFVEAN